MVVVKLLCNSTYIHATEVANKHFSGSGTCKQKSKIKMREQETWKGEREREREREKEREMERGREREREREKEYETVNKGDKAARAKGFALLIHCDKQGSA